MAEQKKTPCPRCKRPATQYDVGKSFASEEDTKRYDELCSLIEDRREELEHDRDEMEEDEELQEALEERSLLSKKGVGKYEINCRECGYDRVESGKTNGAIGYCVYVVPHDHGSNCSGMIFPGANIDAYILMATDPRSAHDKEPHHPLDPPYEEPLYVRVTMWDEASQSVKVLAERGDPKAWKTG